MGIQHMAKITLISLSNVFDNPMKEGAEVRLA